MFKIKEELIEKRGLPFYDGYNKGVEETFKSFAERVEFYKRYRDNPHLFRMKHNNLWDSIKDEEVFEHWLFNYCFKDVIE